MYWYKQRKEEKEGEEKEEEKEKNEKKKKGKNIQPVFKWPYLEFIDFIAIPLWQLVANFS